MTWRESIKMKSRRTKIFEESSRVLHFESQVSITQVTLILTIIISVICFNTVVSAASVIYDVHNMLRYDEATTSKTTTDKGGDIGGGDGYAVSSDIDSGSDNEKSEMKCFPSLSSLHAKQQQKLRIGSVDADGEDSLSIGKNSIEGDSSLELLRFVNDSDGPEGGPMAIARDALSLNDQVRLLKKQFTALMMRRREDYELLERNLRKSLNINRKGGAGGATSTAVTKKSNVEVTHGDVYNELKQLRREVRFLRESQCNGNKQFVTINWLQQSVIEIQKELFELQQITSKITDSANRRIPKYEDSATIRNDFQQLKLELAAANERQQQTEVYVKELRKEVLQQEEDYKRLLHNLQFTVTTSNVVLHDDVSHDEKLNTEALAGHQHHYRLQHQQMHELQLAQHNLKRQLNELKYHRIAERIRNIEVEQHRIADANFNLSRQISSLDKLHTSMLELFEDVEGLQNKIDKNVPDLRHEISKLEFSNAQLNAEQSLVREEGKNFARSLQAMAVSVSALQDERNGVKQIETNAVQLEANIDRLQSMMTDIQYDLIHRGKGEKLEQQQNYQKDQNHSQQQYHYHHHHGLKHQHNNNSSINNVLVMQHAESLVAKLENVEEQYESIINKLPQDCSKASSSSANTDGLYLIAPAGQYSPLMVHCTADEWTTVQRRYDGSVDFNRSWEDYATGFGAPAGEYWIGNEQLYHLTRNNCTALRVLMQDIYDNVWLAEYDNFYISSHADGYRLHISGYRGNASDALDYQQGMQFSAIDVDRDISQTHCAANYESGWWFSHCQHANLNGPYNLGLTWFDAARNEWIAVKSSQMLIKRQTATMCHPFVSDAIAFATSEPLTSQNTVSKGNSRATMTTATKTIMATIMIPSKSEMKSASAMAAATVLLNTGVQV